MSSYCWQFEPGSSLDRDAAAWDAINARAGHAPFLDSAFLRPLLRHFGRGDERIGWCRRGDTVVAAAIVERSGAGRVATFQPSQLPLGPWLVASGENADAIAESLLAQLPGFVLGLGLTQLDPKFMARPATTPRVGTLDYVDTAWVDVDQPFDAYWEQRGKNLRTNMRKQRSKLAADGVELRFETLRDAADVPAAIAEYGRLETAGWKAESGTAVHADNAQGRLYTEALTNFCVEGRGRIWRLKFGDKVVAIDLCIEAGDTLVVLKTAFDPEYRTVSPAFLLRQDAFRQVFDEGRIRRIEFYGRLMEWHTRWTDRSRTLYHTNLYRWALVPRLRDQWRRLAAPREAHPAAPVSSSAENS